MSAVSNIKDGFRLAMELANAANRVGDVAKLIEAQQQVLQVLDENRQLRSRVAELEDELAMESQLERQGFTYSIREKDGSLTGPICPGCYKRNRVVSRLLTSSSMRNNMYCVRCRESCQL